MRCFASARSNAGVTAILVSETGGEASTLTPAEQEGVIRAAVGVAQGRVRVIAGVGSNSTSRAIELTRRAEAAGADAVLSVVPYYNKPTQAGIQAHFTAIAVSTALPIILHDVPSRTMRELSDDTLVQLASSRHIHRTEGCNWRHPQAIAFAAASAGRISAVIRGRHDGTALHRQWRRRLHFHRLERRAATVPDRCLRTGRRARPQTARYLQERLAPLTAALTQGESGGAEIRTLPARLHVPGHPPSHRRTDRRRQRKSQARLRRSAVKTPAARSGAGTGLVLTGFPWPSPRWPGMPLRSDSYIATMRCAPSVRLEFSCSCPHIMDVDLRGGRDGCNRFQHRAACSRARLRTVLVAVGEKFDVFVGHGRALQKGLNMPLLTHTGRPFWTHSAFSSAMQKQTGAPNAHLAMIKRFCLITLTTLLAVGAVGAIIALKTAAVLSRFAH